LELSKDGYAYCLVGDFYRFGWGVAQNKEEAFKYYIESAKLGYANAQYNVGIYLHEGKGGQAKDAIAANEWMIKAAKQGQKDAIKFLEKSGN
jgi:TPR repeat protein